MCGGVERSGTPLLRQLLSLLPPSLGLLSRPFSVRSGASKNQSDRDSFPQLSETACAARVRVELCSRSGFSFFAVRDQKEGERVKPQASCSACFKPV